jgi:hypothetical protein
MQLRDLDIVLEALEQMNMERATAVPGRVAQLLHELGLMDHDALSAPELMVRVLDKQQHVLRQRGSMRRESTTV